MDNKEKSPEKELIESIGLMIEKGMESNTNIYTGVVKSVDGKRAVVAVNGQNQNVSIATADVSSGNVVRVFVPEGNMSAAFIIKAEASGGGGGTTTTAYGDLTGKPRINGVTLVDNKTSKELNLYGTDNAPPYPVTSVNGQTGNVTISAGGNVDSVNGKTGVVVLNKSDVGLGNVDNVRQYSTSNPPPYPVKSVDGATGAVVTNAVKTTPQSLSDTQKQQVRNNIGAGTSSFDGDYNSLTNKPTIPTKTSQLTNDSGFITDIPIASATQLGGVKVGAGLSVTENGVLSATGGGTADSVEWNNVLDKPTTIAGYGITDAKIENGTITLGNQTITPLTSAPVTSVNSKTGAVQLNANDVGALPNTTVIPTKTSQLNNDSGYITANDVPVKSVDGATGDVVTNAVKTTTQTLTDAQKQQARTNIGAGTSNFSGSYDDLSNKPTIPDQYTLPVASSTTLGGVKPVAKTSNMTQSVGVDVNGALYTAPGGGGTGSGDMLKSVYDPQNKSTDIFKYANDAANDRQAKILVDGILEGDGAGNISAAETVQAELLDVEVLPTVTTADNGKFLRVVNGAWAVAEVDNASGVSF